MNQVRQRRAARRDPRYQSAKHDASTWTRRGAVKDERRKKIVARQGRQKRTGVA